MFKSVKISYDDVSGLLMSRGGNKAILIAQINLDLLEELIRFLERLEEATLKLESYLQPSLHIVAFERNELLQHCEIRTKSSKDVDESEKEVVIPRDSDNIATIKRLVKDVLTEKWHVEDLHVLAALLDPRQKDRLAIFEVSFVQVRRCKTLLKTIMQDVAENVDADVESLEVEVVKERPSKRRRTRPGLCNSDEEDEGMSGRTATVTLTLAEKIQREFDHYFTLKLTKDEKRTFELLLWWKMKGMIVTT
ncbi:hypothetical protein CBR_g1093 [Chara braunii]|uniref:Uncharacterized protein n=1 Tax=Chara braunii TaxID=69332 RepID=A0A388KD35_CHABU|nr:hypothetical protein CBR_g1093 [Chara braunii]|eukprot:GBG67974.1 hypothetical protein CBR_g1093 [Chara braunii]